MELINQLAFEIVEGQITLEDVVDGLTEQELNRLQNVIKIYKSTKIAVQTQAYRKLQNALASKIKSLNKQQIVLNLFSCQSLEMFNYVLDGLKMDDTYKDLLKKLESNYRSGQKLNSSTKTSTEPLTIKERFIDAFNTLHNVGKETRRKFNRYLNLKTASVGLQITECEKKIGTLQTVFVIAFIGDALQEIANALNPNI